MRLIQCMSRVSDDSTGASTRSVVSPSVDRRFSCSILWHCYSVQRAIHNVMNIYSVKRYSVQRAIHNVMNIYSVKRICKLPQVEMMVKAGLGTCDVFQMGTHIVDTQHGIDNHFFDLMALIVHVCYTVRQHHTAKVYNIRQPGAAVGQQLTKTVLFKEQ